MNLPESARYIIEKLRKSGHRADVVGGSVRDFLRGEMPSDYDMTTDATPDEMQEVFSADRTVETGIKHGTLTVIVDGAPFEVTTYRVDGEYTDNRHPASVSFTRALSDDLSRRDFTVNAIAYNERDGYTDLFGGRADIENRIIRAVGKPNVRFSEDALRILRALRFSATLDFKIEENTARAIHEERKRLENVSRERIYTEWKKLIAGPRAYRVISEYSDVISQILGICEDIKLPDYDRFCKSEARVRELSIFALNSANAAKDVFLSAMSNLKADNKTRDFGKAVLDSLTDATDTEVDINLLLIKTSPEVAEGTIELKALLGDTSASLDTLKKLLSDNVCYRISDIKIDGNDLRALGFAGKQIGEIFTKLLTMIAKKEIKNEREDLLSFVAEMR